MRQAAAERAAVADRIMGDMAHHVGQQLAERPVADRAMERGVAHAGADRKLAVHNRDAVERRDAVDIDEMAPAWPAGTPWSAPGSGRRRARGRPAARPRRAAPPPRRPFSARDSGTPQASSAGFNFGIGVSFLNRCTVFGTESKCGKPQKKYTLRMKPPPFSYHDPRTTADVVGLLGQPRQRQAAGRRAVADADAQHALRAAGPCHRSQPGRGLELYPRARRRARDRRHDAAARYRIFRAGAASAVR